MQEQAPKVHNLSSTRAFIVCAALLTSDGRERLIGGIQTYVWHLARLLADIGFHVTVVQSASQAFEQHLGGFACVRGVRVRAGMQTERLARRLVDAIPNLSQEDLVIFATEQVSCRLPLEKTILVQHGVSWDMDFSLVPSPDILRSLSRHIPILGTLRKHFQQMRYRAYFANAKTKVCVDHNFPNWLRATAPASLAANIRVIPNPAFPQDAVVSSYEKRYRTGPTRVIFSRRFEKYRGCLVMAEAARRLLDAGHNIHFTFAGEGPERDRMRESLQPHEGKYVFTKYLLEDSLAVHSDFDIAVVPSLASEGTSLAVVEAMAAGCAVVATPVGGITNLLIDDFNGIFVDAGSVDELVKAILRLHLSRDERDRLSRNARSVVEQSYFSFEKWRQRWEEVINETMAPRPLEEGLSYAAAAHESAQSTDASRLERPSRIRQTKPP